MAEDRLRTGRPEEADRLLRMADAADPQVAALRRRIDNLRWRKCFRQRKADALDTAAERHPALALAAARIAGRPALEALAAADGPQAGLAAVALAPDAEQALRIWRKRCPEQAALAGAWMLLRKGHAGRALERFAGASASEPLRASLGQALCLAVSGRIDAARGHWQHVGPLPGGVFPPAAAFAAWLESARHEPLDDLLQGADRTALARAVESCPSQDAERQAWLLLRLGDRLVAAGERRQGERCYARASARHPAVAIDVRKRQVHAQLADGVPPDRLFTLYEALRDRDPALAREAIEELGPLIADEDLKQLTHRRWLPDARRPPRELPPEWARLWLRRALPSRSTSDLLAALLAGGSSSGLPRSVRELDPLLARLDAAYGTGDHDYLHLLMRVYRHYGNRTRQRQVCFRLMMDDPAGADALVPTYASLAVQDRRGKKTIGAELAQLRARLPHVLRLHLLGLAFGEQGEAAIARCERDCGPAAAALMRWTIAHARGEAPLPQAMLGRDVQVDSVMIGNLADPRHVGQQQYLAICDRLIADPDACLLAAERCLHEGYHLPVALLRRWLRQQPHSWQAAFITLRAVADSADPDEALDLLEELRAIGEAASRDALFTRAEAGIAATDENRRQVLDRIRVRLAQLDEIVGMDDDDLLDQEPSIGLATDADPGAGGYSLADLCPVYWHGLPPDDRATLIVMLDRMEGRLDDPQASLLPLLAECTTAQRQLLAGFSNALITEATMFDPRVQADPVYRQLLGLGPARIREGAAP